MATRTAPTRVLRSPLRVIPGRPAARPAVRVSFRQLIGLGLAIAMFFALIYSRIALDRAAFQIDTLDGLISEQEGRFDELRLQVAQLESPQRIYHEAQLMGLVLPTEGRTVTAPMPPR